MQGKPISEKELLQKAFSALLDGDTAERDRLCDLAKHKQKQRVRVQEGGPSPVDLVLGEDGITFEPTKK